MKGGGSVDLVTDAGHTAGANTPTPIDVTQRARECVARYALDDTDRAQLLDMLGLLPRGDA